MNMDFTEQKQDGIDWYTVDAPGFVLDGLYWRKPGDSFHRLPPGGTVSPGVDFHAWHTAGVMARFCTDASEIRIHAALKKYNKMDHIPCTGLMGFDLYTGSHTAKYYTRTSRFDQNCQEYDVTIFGPDAAKKIREFTLHFPLYAHPAKLMIGLSKDSQILPPSPWKDPRPIVVYGTSIQQGGCASRPGMCMTNIMSRLLDRPFLNFGFSSSANGEPAMAEIIARIDNPAMIVLDYDANAGVVRLEKTLSRFIDILREKHPKVPLLLVSRLPYAREIAEPLECNQERLALTSIHLKELQTRRATGDENIHFLDGATLYGSEPSECTVDGVHATDLGFFNIAHRMAPVIERLLTQV